MQIVYNLNVVYFLGESMAKITVDGNTAAAEVAYACSEVAAIYPITPSSTMAEIADSKSCAGETNIFGERVKVVEMQSEAGAAGAVHGSLSAGALTTTFTSSQGLLLMIPNMYKIAGELLPTVFHVSARAIATHALSIFGDHSDVMATRQTGFALLCSNSVQEAQDLALIAHSATLKTSVPFLHFFDGFRTSHELNTIDALDKETMAKMIPMDKVNDFRSRALSSAHPHQQGTSQTPDIFFQNREACNYFYDVTPSIVDATMKEFYRLTGRKYGLFDYIGSKNAENIIVMMGSGAETCESTINYLNSLGENYGLVKVHLYRPFSIKHFVSALPKTVKRIAVLDRCKESGAAGEPLYKDVISALAESGLPVQVVGGRYGLGSFEFTPSMVNAVFDNLKLAKPKNHFTVGIEDDMANTNIPIKKQISIYNDVTACKFFGYGGDGTVSANKNSIKIIGNKAGLYGQAYFEYDSKKTGNATISHLRFGKNKINESYLLTNIDFVACHNQSYISKFDLCAGLKKGGTLLINTGWGIDQFNKFMPAGLKREIANNKIRVFTIDATEIAKQLGLGSKINLIMQSAFFKLLGLIPFETSKAEMKKYAEISYGKKGPEILQKNFSAIDSAENEIKELNYPASWKTAQDSSEEGMEDNEYYREFIHPIETLHGNRLPVSAFDARGFVPTNTSKLEKRGTAESIPCWKSENCIQCNMCSFVCPHAAIRPYLTKNLPKKPNDLQSLPATAEPDKQFILQVSPMDCTGCGVCAKICPARNKALEMTPADDVIERERTNFNYISAQKTVKSDKFNEKTIKGSQFNKPYFEFSGACAGCGETPYIKVISQLFGDHMIIANATGCSSIYGGSSPACPFAQDERGRGIAWANSLFEDNAEFGYGIELGAEVKRDRLFTLLQRLSEHSSSTFKNLSKKLMQSEDRNEQHQLALQLESMLETETFSAQDKDDLNSVLDSAVKESVWIVGGDGWAYDIGFGGLDHVVASGKNVNILVLDTEVYSNTGGQSSKATPTGAVAKFASMGKRTKKKDLALMLTTYGNVYVAKVAMGANMNQFMKAVLEAEAFDGPSVIIAYAPCINHGIDMSNSQLEMKKAVDCGYWQLFRYNPALKKQGENPFTLDSNPTADFMEFVKGENRYKSLLKQNPELGEKLLKDCEKEAKDTLETYKTLSEQ